jgi:hypothetical protein
LGRNLKVRLPSAYIAERRIRAREAALTIVDLSIRRSSLKLELGIFCHKRYKHVYWKETVNSIRPFFYPK